MHVLLSDLNMNKSSKLANLICRNNQVNGSSHQKYHEEMIYWSDIPFDSEYKSPFYDPNKYLTFEPDHGGWNNIRMAMETVSRIILIHQENFFEIEFFI